MFPVAISLKLFMPSTLHFSCLFRLKLNESLQTLRKLHTNQQITKQTYKLPGQ